MTLYLRCLSISLLLVIEEEVITLVVVNQAIEWCFAQLATAHADLLDYKKHALLVLRQVVQVSIQGAHHLVVQGQSRFRVLEFLPGWPFLVARVSYVETKEEMNPELEARFLQLKQQAIEAILRNAINQRCFASLNMTAP